MEILEGIELDSSIKETISKKIADVIKIYETKVSDAESKLADAITTRQKTKEKIAVLEKQIAEGNPESKKIMEEKQKELDELSSKVEQLNTEKEQLSAKILAADAAERERIMSKLPDGKAKEAAELITDINALSKFAEAISENVNTNRGDTGSKFNKSHEGFISKADAEKMSPEEITKNYDLIEKSMSNW